MYYSRDKLKLIRCKRKTEQMTVVIQISESLPRIETYLMYRRHRYSLRFFFRKKSLKVFSRPFKHFYIRQNACIPKRHLKKNDNSIEVHLFSKHRCNLHYIFLHQHILCFVLVLRCMIRLFNEFRSFYNS